MVLDLEVEATREVSSDVAPVRGGSLYLRPVPVYLAILGRVPVGLEEVVRKRKGDGESERLCGRHHPDMEERSLVSDGTRESESVDFPHVVMCESEGARESEKAVTDTNHMQKITVSRQKDINHQEFL